MSDDILKLVTKSDLANEQTVMLLNEYLELAKKGEIVAVALASIYKNGESQTAATDTDQFQLLIGALAILQYRMLHERKDEH